jgi:hypothetical protein
VRVDQILHLTPDDDLASLRERLKRTLADTVIVIVPNDVSILRNAVNVKLLRRYAEQMAINIVIVTRDGPTGDLARSQSFPVYPALERIPRQNRAGLSKEQLAGVPGLPGVPFYRRLVQLGFWLTAPLVLAAGVFLMALVAVFLAPSATITVVPANQMITTTLAVTASPQIRALDIANGQVPARPVEVLIEDTGQVLTTGNKRVPDATATGTVVFANRSLGPLTIPKGTTVRTSTGISVRFRTDEDASLPAGAFSTVRVPVKAVDPGLSGNVKAGNINAVEGPLSFQVSVLNDADTTGGTEKQVKYVTLQDRNNLSDSIVQRIRGNSYNELLKANPPGDILPAETLTLVVNEASFDKPLDTEGTYLTGKVRATVSGLVLDKENLDTMVSARLEDQVPPGFSILLGGITLGAPTNVHYSDGVLTLQITASALSQAEIDAEQVQRIAAWQTPEDAMAAIAQSFQLAKAPEIELANSRFDRMPYLTARIKVNVEAP